MRFILTRLYQVSGGLAALFIVAITGLVFIQVLFNIIDRLAKLLTGSAIGLTIPSYSDFTGFFLATSLFLALAYTLRAGEHIRINLITSRLPTTLQRGVELVSMSLALILSLYATWHTGILVYESWQYQDMSSGIVAVPLWIPQSSIVLGLAILSIALLDGLVSLLNGQPATDPTASGEQHYE